MTYVTKNVCIQLTVNQHAVLINQGSKGESQVNCLLFSFWYCFLIVSHIPLRSTMQIQPFVVGWRMLGCTCSIARGTWSNFSNWWASKRQCRAKHVSIRCPGTGFLFLLLHFLVRISVQTKTRFLEVSWRLWPFCELWLRCVWLVRCLLLSGSLPSAPTLPRSLVVHLATEWLIKFTGASKGRVMGLNWGQYQCYFKAKSSLHPLRWQ